uniref:Leucine-rich repeat-containing N-terminal plant-type domain-containing protein n=1 Tax=Cannabis sativa TaxID=3483 RepID=A0A803PYC6_CANSA
MILLWFMLLVLVTPANVVSLESDQPQCIPKEREALLSFKKTTYHVKDDDLVNLFLLDPNFDYLSSWANDQNCCNWNGISCDQQTNHVTAIDLYGGLNVIGGEIDSSLAELQHLNHLMLGKMNISRIPKFIGSFKELTYLNLLDNEITAIPNSIRSLKNLTHLIFGHNKITMIPSFVGSFKELTYLNLVGNPISGVIPPQLGNLTKLQSLDLSSSSQMSNYEWISRLTSLNTLTMSGVNFTVEQLQSFKGAPFLSSLSISDCLFPKVDNFFLSHTNASFQSLQDLTLDGNSIHDPLTITWLLNSSTHLMQISLSNNIINGSFPNSFQQTKSLQFVDLSSNEVVESGVPKSLGNLPNLKKLVLSHNNLGGTIHDVLQNLTAGSTKNSLEILDLSFNQLGGGLILDHDFKNIFPNLQVFKLDGNKLIGLLPDLSSMPNLTLFNASNNKFNGISSNGENNRAVVDLSFNQFQGKEKLKATTIIDLSHNNLFGKLSDCFEGFQKLIVLNLGYNMLSGQIPSSINMKTIETLQLRHNNFSGNLPSSLKNCTSLQVLDLANNNLEGKIPSWIGERLSKLVFLSLKSNKFHASIPLNLCHLVQIQVLDLSINDLSGTIPSCIKNITAMVRNDDQKVTITSSSIMRYMFGHVSFLYENVASITWKGVDHEYVKILGLLRIIDFSSNKLNGEIPIELISLTQLVQLNLSRNNLFGKIPENIGSLTKLDSLDLSHNKLDGLIPISLANVTSLSYMDLSNNRLSGRIPTGTQLQTFNASMYSMNLGLCGPPLSSSCPGDPSYSTRDNEGGDKNVGEIWFDLPWFCKGIGAGFVIGFCGVCGNLWINTSWRLAYFRRMDNIGDWLYVMINIKWTLLRRKVLSLQTYSNSRP